MSRQQIVDPIACLAPQERLVAELREKLEHREAALDGEKAALEKRAGDAAAEPLRRALERKEGALRSSRAKLDGCQASLLKAQDDLAALQAEAAKREARFKRQAEGAQEELAADADAARAQTASLKWLVHEVALALEQGSPAHPDEDRQLAELSQSLLQISPADLGLSPRADITPGADAAPQGVHASRGGSVSRGLLGELLDPLDASAALAVFCGLLRQRNDAQQADVRGDIAASQ
jgi:hypothetical protein